MTPIDPFFAYLMMLFHPQSYITSNEMGRKSRMISMWGFERKGRPWVIWRLSLMVYWEELL